MQWHQRSPPSNENRELVLGDLLCILIVIVSCKSMPFLGTPSESIRMLKSINEGYAVEWGWATVEYEELEKALLMHVDLASSNTSLYLPNIFRIGGALCTALRLSSSLFRSRCRCGYCQIHSFRNFYWQISLAQDLSWLPHFIRWASQSYCVPLHCDNAKRTLALC